MQRDAMRTASQDEVVPAAKTLRWPRHESGAQKAEVAMSLDKTRTVGLDGPGTARAVAGVDLDSFPIAEKGNRFEDFTVGQRLIHHWGRTLTEADNVIFCSATCNWHPLYLNRNFAGSHGHRREVVHPMLVLCTVVGLSVEDLSEAGGPFLGVEDCTFRLPVHAGDTLTATSEVLDKRESSSRPGVGIVTWRTEGANQRGEVVLDFQRSNLVRFRNAS
jgi:itaconyl-CoA hydratase